MLFSSLSTATENAHGKNVKLEALLASVANGDTECLGELYKETSVNIEGTANRAENQFVISKERIENCKYRTLWQGDLLLLAIIFSNLLANCN